MRPAICSVCGVSVIQNNNGDWVTFSDYKKTDNEEIGHPGGLEWFCESHLEEARLLSGKKAEEALSELRNKYPETEAISSRKEKKHWWQRLINR